MVPEAPDPEPDPADPGYWPGWGLLWRSALSIVGLVVLLAGLATLVALLAFPESAVAGPGGLADLSPAGRVLVAGVVTAAGFGLIWAALAEPVRIAYRVRMREEARERREAREPGPAGEGRTGGEGPGDDA